MAHGRAAPTPPHVMDFMAAIGFNMVEVWACRNWLRSQQSTLRVLQSLRLWANRSATSKFDWQTTARCTCAGRS
ncbi:putative long-chain-fatty-acid--CoA ligase domain protein [Mycobacterium xenopi 3993]|nr:putative long-chain-fatty-acid--CoA ligase domain protein [Mycobacterium xenopi 3993]